MTVMSSLLIGRAETGIDYRSLFHSAPAALLVLDPDLIIVEVSDAYLAATMRDRGELVGKPLFTAFPANPDDTVSDGVNRLAASLERVRHEVVTDVMAIQKYDIPQPGGGFVARYWAPVNSPVLGDDGEIVLFVHRVEDVTEFVCSQHDDALERLADELRVCTVQMETEVFARRRAQERIATLEAVADSLDTAIVACDAAGRPVLRNHAARELLGDLLRGRPVEQWPDQLRRQLERALGGEPVHDTEVFLRHPGQSRRVLRMNIRPLAGQPELAVVVALRDVTGRRLAARLQEGELEIAHLIGHGEPDAETLQRVMTIVGTSIGWTAAEFWIVDEVTRSLRLEARWADPVDQGHGLAGRVWQAATPVWETESLTGGVLAVPVPAGPKPLGVLVCHSDTADVSDELRAAVVTGVGARLGELLERRRAERLSAELERTRDEYIALVGHELRTPLTSIQAHTDLMLDDPALDGDQRDALEVMRRNTASLRAIVMRLLDVAGLRWGHIELHRGPADLAVLAHDAAVGRTGIVVDAPSPVPVDGDRSRLREVLDELLGNALTWAAPDSTVGVEVRAESGAAVVAVTNSGSEIAVEERGRLFDLFFRGEAARYRGVPGNGLGLTVARAIVEQHGGTLIVSEPGGAETTFTMRLPLTV